MGSRLEANSSAVRKRIEKHKFEDEEGEEYQPSKFGGFNDYFRRKKIKLQNLDAELRSSAGDYPPIFRGIVAHVNGYTQPSLNDLHTLIVRYGGGFMQYLDGKTTVTHIIASNLTPKKKVEFAKYRIVKPAWVVDSVKAGKALAWNAYRVVDEGASQQILGIENGGIVSANSTQRTGYRDQTDTSWYTESLRHVAENLDLADSVQSASTSLLNAQTPTGDYQEDLDDLKPEHNSEGIARDENSWTYGPVRSHSSPEGFNTPFHARSSYIDVETPVPPSVPIDRLEDQLDQVDIREEEQPLQIVTDQEPESTTAISAEEHNAQLLSDPKVWKSTVVNPAFLKQYYEESRLHHLSAWKADLKSKLQALAAEKSALSQSTRPKRIPGARNYILYVDFDSFFAAVSLKKHPELVDKPVVIAHGGGSGSEIASSNYPARKFGIKNGMWMKHAQKLCPDLKVLPYDFKAYEGASKNFYEAILDTGGIVQSVSVDEALVDISFECIEAGAHGGKGVHEGSTWREQAKADEIALGIRETVKEKTGCAVSIGIGGNVLLAKLALRKAKPAGQYHVKPEEVLDFVGGVTVQELPGVAYSIGGKLEEIGVKYVNDVRNLTKERLITTLGPKTGEKIWNYSRGIDKTEVGEQAIRKSVSAEVNWGIRFVTQEQADEFVQCLCEELQNRLVTEKVKGRQLTMKIMRRAPDAPLDPPKHLGHGKCDTYNKSVVLGVATNDKDLLSREAISIMHGWGFSPGELRGIGVQMTKLEPLKGPVSTPVASSQRRLQFDSASPQKTANVRDDTADIVESPLKPQALSPYPAAAYAATTSPSGRRRSQMNTLGTQFVLPSQVDPEVLAELPADIRSKFQTGSVGAPKSLAELASNSFRPASPIPHPDDLPSHSQLDKEALSALPEDVRAEVLSYYQRSPRKPHARTLLPQSPHKERDIDKSKKITTPTKKRTGLLFRGRGGSKANAASTSTLTQSNFVANRAATSQALKTVDGTSIDEEVSAEFLAALPEDIRQEVLDQQRRNRLKKRGGIDFAANHTKKRLLSKDKLLVGQRRLQLPARPSKPTFTARKLTALPDLRNAMSAWVEEFRDEIPDAEDVTALVTYLQRVVKEESDMPKALGVVRWLKWLVDDQCKDDGRVGWLDAVEKVQEGVQQAVRERGLGRVEF